MAFWHGGGDIPTFTLDFVASSCHNETERDVAGLIVTTILPESLMLHFFRFEIFTNSRKLQDIHIVLNTAFGTCLNFWVYNLQKTFLKNLEGVLRFIWGGMFVSPSPCCSCGRLGSVG